MILTMSEYHKNLLSDSPLSLLSIVNFFSFLKINMIQKIPKKNLLKNHPIHFAETVNENLKTNQKQRLPTVRTVQKRIKARLNL